MGKTVKKRHRRMKKRVRQTLASLFLISAIIIAAIPVDGLRAADNNLKLAVSVDTNNCKIPLVPDNETIYTTGDGQYQFAYVSPNDVSAGNKVAVILGYNGGYLNNGLLTIPDSVDAYLKYSDNLGTTSGYAAVGKRGNFLFYPVVEFVYDEMGNIIYDPVLNVDEEGQPILDEDGGYTYNQVARTTTSYFPCYYEDYNRWKDLAVDEFYYISGVDSEGENIYALTTISEVQRIQDAEVWYIGNQYLEAGTGNGEGGNGIDTGTWKVKGLITDSSHGIFAGQGNIRNLVVGEKLSGIGNYAFYGCSGMQSITLGNGLDTIGNWAFANCINMSGVNVDLYSRVDIIGDHAFYNCQALKTFNMPISVTAIGDSAFAGCYSLEEIDLCGAGSNVSLTEIGEDVFINCANLKSLTFPRTFTNNKKPIEVGTFEGCGSLAFISTSNNLISFEDSEDYSFDDFRADVPSYFYFEGLADSEVHTIATDNFFAFSYLGEDLYEITIKDKSGNKAVYRVNSSNQLVYSNIDSNMKEIVLPETIGPYYISVIETGTFQNKYNLEKITIPSSILSIESNAFKGCYNLKNVIFNEPVNLENIGKDAFKTQEVSLLDESAGLPSLPTDPELKFIGPVGYSSVPFQYAMDPDNNINAGSQKKTYITYYSGWPTNLEIRYNYNTDKNELIGYPTFYDLKLGTKYTTDNYAYMTEELEKAAKDAVYDYNNDRSEMTDYEWGIINAALNMVIPEGVESIQADLYANNEAKDSIDKTITAYSLKDIAAESFKGCKNLTAIYLMDGTQTIGDYAFEDCTNLTEVYIPTTVTELGKIPFTGCKKLSYVNFQGSPYFTCEGSIVFSLEPDGSKDEIIEYLYARPSGVINAAELQDANSVAPEAFRGTKVSSVDFRSTQITDLPVDCFAETPYLFAVYLPYTCASISEDSFRDSAIQYLEIPSSVSYIDNDAFSGTTSKSGLTFNCEEGSAAALYAEKNNITITSKAPEIYYTVTFWDYDSTLLDTQMVLSGNDAVAPEVPGREGYKHTGWVPDYHGVNSNLQVTAQYEAIDPDSLKHTVTFIDWDDSVLATRLVADGEDAEPPVDPVREDYVFTGWRPAITNITADTIVYAQYEKIDSSEKQLTVRFLDYDETVLYIQKVNYGEDAIKPKNPSRSGYKFTGWVPSIKNVTKDMDTVAQYEKKNTSSNNDNSGSDNGNNNGNNSGGIQSKVYTLTVVNGSGSGSYVAGSQPVISANEPAKGMEFSNWTVSSKNVKLASTTLPATLFTMPEENITITANYKAKSGQTDNGSTNNGSNSGNTNGNGTGNSNNSNSGNGSGQNTNGGSSSSGTTVVIDKNGLSNTGVVSATVKGSSDNFTIKVVEDASATEEILRALNAEYGDDLSNIKYFPMDISLYDSTGKNKISDTTGLSISITLPLPDSLITYAGNNKVASVSNGKLDKLDVKFTTISGVSCVTFTAEHFSPYVIYVNTSNLSAGTISDTTPKTGDGIHPKWFLVICLTCVSAILFLKKDKRAPKRVVA